jgi:hypothetical protein
VQTICFYPFQEDNKTNAPISSQAFWAYRLVSKKPCAEIMPEGLRSLLRLTHEKLSLEVFFCILYTLAWLWCYAQVSGPEALFTLLLSSWTGLHWTHASSAEEAERRPRFPASPCTAFPGLVSAFSTRQWRAAIFGSWLSFHFVGR